MFQSLGYDSGKDPGPYSGQLEYSLRSCIQELEVLLEILLFSLIETEEIIALSFYLINVWYR